MLDIDIKVLKAAEGLGLAEPDLDRVAATVRTALTREFEAERRGEAAREGSGGFQPKRWILAALAALVVAGGAAAGYAALTGSGTESEGIGCYAGGKVGESATVVALDGRPATETCADLWREGGVVPGERAAPAPLHACVSPEGDGPVRVLASRDPEVCEEAGLIEDPAAGSDPAARRFGAFSAELSATLERDEFACADRGRVRRVAEGLLASHGLKGWSVREGGRFDQANRCATVALDSDARTVTVLPGLP